MIEYDQKPLREAMVGYLAGEIDIDEFENRLISEYWIGEFYPTTQSLVDEIHLLLAERSNGHWSAAEFDEKLKDLQSHPVTICLEP